ncbi:Gfo/Idh/MocA family oxidoreductase [Asanoa sp. NPDC050611]|uniref:Gfo/Idh/MocA family protein n=1 Tax=Asanoa sp. NPDC050611 TaxID=3157098 RepID=UPI0033FC6682
MTVNVAVVGTGRIARVHAEAYRHVSGARLTTCTDPNTAAAEAFAKDYGLRISDGLDKILQDDTIDAVLLASPNAVHADQTIQALRAGKHVFCQKPISLTLADADRVVEAAADSDRILQHGFMLRFTPPLPGLKQRLADGELGDPIAARAAVFGWEPTNDWFYDPAQGGGVILDTLVHFGDLVQWLFGPAATVYTAGGAYVLEGAKRHRSPDNATVTVTHETGVVTSMYVTWTAGHGNFTIEAYGSKGGAAVDLVHAQAMRTFEKAHGWAYPDLVWDYGYRGEQQYFADRITGRVDGTQAATPRQARDALALVLAAQRSLDEGTVVKP